MSGKVEGRTLRSNPVVHHDVTDFSNRLLRLSTSLVLFRNHPTPCLIAPMGSGLEEYHPVSWQRVRVRGTNIGPWGVWITVWEPSLLP